ncbi:MAG TPA: class I SAM-dependent methyltransferase [Stellaceae bacterium]|nr:class I SAM-dependent methyltransferase [Stellaceae bacterium]
MGLYGRYVLPRITDLAMRNKAPRLERARYVPLAAGVVLEVGAGSALNLPFYGEGVERLVALEPSRELWSLGRARVHAARFPVDFVPASAEAIPAPDRSFDSAVMTWTLCTVADPGAALAEIARVLKPAGRLIFIEHGKAPDAGVAAWQDRLNPLWRPLAGGCNMNREIASLVAASGLVVDELETGYAAGPRVLSYLYKGVATRRR